MNTHFTILAKMLKPLVLSIALIGIYAVSQSSVKADPLVPGATIPGPSTSAIVPGTFSVLALNSTTFQNSTLGGTARTAVVLDNTTGLLTFYYQFSSTGGATTPDDVNRIAMFNFTGFTTNVSQVTNGSVLGDGFVNGTVASTTADRNATGATVGFNFAPGTFNVGTTSLTFCIATNAVNFTTGNFSIQDGVNQNTPAFSPSAATPEPATMLLFGTGIAGLASRLRKRRKSE